MQEMTLRLVFVKLVRHIRVIEHMFTETCLLAFIQYTSESV